ncbi:MAG: hypothetical protein HY694_13575 [Deltaproteobacteria bacterium]|nr:hypothetical protein [Deltaproteobacteria bacterium]
MSRKILIPEQGALKGSDSFSFHDRETRTFDLKEGRRPAGYVIASQTSKVFDDPGIFVPIALVNQIRPRVKAWREAGYPGATGITKRLLEHWHNLEERENRETRNAESRSSTRNGLFSPRAI